MGQPQERDRRKSRILPMLLLGGITWYVWDRFGPLLIEGGKVINPITAPAAFILMSCCMALLSDWLWYLGNLYDQKSALTPGDNKGTARFVQSREEIAHELIDTGWGPYWGAF